MQKIADTTNLINLDDALYTLAAQARTRYAGEHLRIDRGLVLALNGHVTLHADGTADVQSASDPEIIYHVAHGTCDCPDFTRAQEGRCKHRWAKCLVKRAQQAPAAPTYYATYYPEEGIEYQGTAQYVNECGWIFRSHADDYHVAYADHALLALGGRCDIADAQRAQEEAEGGLVARICNHNGARRQ